MRFRENGGRVAVHDLSVSGRGAVGGNQRDAVCGCQSGQALSMRRPVGWYEATG
jgi:hypothetical protein